MVPPVGGDTRNRETMYSRQMGLRARFVKQINFLWGQAGRVPQNMPGAGQSPGGARQRPPTPSCRGLSPYRGENSEPGRYCMESLTPIPELENSLGQSETFRQPAWTSAIGVTSDLRQVSSDFRI